MLLFKTGDCLVVNNVKYWIGMAVMAQNCMYEGLKGIITEIRTGHDIETENPGPDIYCSFQESGDIADHKGSVPYVIKLDGLIMAPEMLKPLSLQR